MSLLPCDLAIPGPLVETGSLVTRESGVGSFVVGEGFAGGAEGAGEAEGRGDASVTAGCVETGVGVTCGTGTIAAVLVRNWIAA